VCLFNNEQWGAEKKNHVDFYSNRFLGVNLENPSFAAIAKAFGCEGVRVDRCPTSVPRCASRSKRRAKARPR
jgi:sulfoacetaldehyde acetyltransferase